MIHFAWCCDLHFTQDQSIGWHYIARETCSKMLSLSPSNLNDAFWRHTSDVSLKWDNLHNWSASPVLRAIHIAFCLVLGNQWIYRLLILRLVLIRKNKTRKICILLPCYTMYNFVYETPQSAIIEMRRITEIWQISVILRILILRIVVFHTTIYIMSWEWIYFAHFIFADKSHPQNQRNVPVSENSLVYSIFCAFHFCWWEPQNFPVSESLLVHSIHSKPCQNQTQIMDKLA